MTDHCPTALPAYGPTWGENGYLSDGLSMLRQSLDAENVRFAPCYGGGDFIDPLSGDCRGGPSLPIIYSIQEEVCHEDAQQQQTHTQHTRQVHQPGQMDFSVDILWDEDLVALEGQTDSQDHLDPCIHIILDPLTSDQDSQHSGSPTTATNSSSGSASSSDHSFPPADETQIDVQALLQGAEPICAKCAEIVCCCAFAPPATQSCQISGCSVVADESRIDFFWSEPAHYRPHDPNGPSSSQPNVPYGQGYGGPYPNVCFDPPPSISWTHDAYIYTPASQHWQAEGLQAPTQFGMPLHHSSPPCFSSADVEYYLNLYASELDDLIAPQDTAAGCAPVHVFANPAWESWTPDHAFSTADRLSERSTSKPRLDPPIQAVRVPHRPPSASPAHDAPQPRAAATERASPAGKRKRGPSADRPSAESEETDAPKRRKHPGYKRNACPGTCYNGELCPVLVPPTPTHYYKQHGYGMSGRWFLPHDDVPADLRCCTVSASKESSAWWLEVAFDFLSRVGRPNREGLLVTERRVIENPRLMQPLPLYLTFLVDLHNDPTRRPVEAFLKDAPKTDAASLRKDQKYQFLDAWWWVRAAPSHMRKPELEPVLSYYHRCGWDITQCRPSTLKSDRQSAGRRQAKKRCPSSEDPSDLFIESWAH